MTAKPISTRRVKRITPAAVAVSSRAKSKPAVRLNHKARAVRSLRNSKPVVNFSGPDTKLVREISVLFGRAKRLIFTNLEQQFAAQGESVQTWRALSQLKKLGRVAQYELAQALAQHPGGISRLLDEIEKDGLVRRKRDVHDRRKVWVELTARGRSRYEALQPTAMRVLYQVLAPLSNEDCRTLSRLLSKIVEPGPALIQAD